MGATLSEAGAPPIAPVGETGRVHKLSIGDAAELAGDVGPDPRLIGVLALTRGRVDLEGLRRQVAASAPELAVLNRRIVHRGRSALSARWQPIPVDLTRDVVAVSISGSPIRYAEEMLVTGLGDEGPMWRIVLLDDGRDTHLLFGAHHTLLDGATAVELVGRLFSTSTRGPAAVRRHSPRTGLPLGLLAGVALGSSRTSLLTPISSGVHLATVSTDLGAAQAAARAAGATINDLLIAAAAGALRAVAASRGERLRHVAISVPVTGQPSAAGPAGRNDVGAFVAMVPEPGPGQSPRHHLSRVARRTRWRKWLVRSFPSSTPAFCAVLVLLGALGWYRPLFERQRAITSLVTNVRGPGEPISVGGARVLGLTALSPALGNVALPR